jgi:hypothetical protein
MGFFFCSSSPVLDAQQHRRIAEDQRGPSRVARPKMPVYPGGVITGELGSRSARESSRPVARSGPFQLSAAPLGRWSCPQAASVSRRPSRPAVVFPLKPCLARRSRARPARRACSDGGSVRGLLRVRRRPGGPAQGHEDPPSQRVASRLEGTIGDKDYSSPSTLARSALLLLGGDKAGNWARWYRDNIQLAEQLYIDYTADEGE